MKNLAAKIQSPIRAPSASKALGFTAVCALAVLLQVLPAVADITNSAVAVGTYASLPVTSIPSVAAVPVVSANLSMQVSKSASPSVNVSAGQVVTYTYVVKNNGNVTIHNISLNDVHNAAGPAPVPNSETLTSDVGTLGDSTDATPADGIWSVLAPGDTVTFTSTYTVQQADVDNLQ
jgi:large repetitive protein